MRPPTALIAVLASVVAAGIASGCGSTGPAVLDPVARAAEATTHTGGAHVAMTIRMDLGSLGGDLTVSANGVLNFAHGEGELLSTISGLPSTSGASSVAMTELYARDHAYISSPLFAGKLPDGASWLGIDLGRAAQQFGLEPQALSSGESNPAEYLDYLKAGGGSLRVVGHAEVRGVQTSHYSGSVDLRKLAAELPGKDRAAAEAAYSKLLTLLGTDSVPVEVWVDGHDLVRRLTLTVPITANGTSLDIQIEEELFGFGATPAVNVPSSGEVYEPSLSSLSGLPGAG